MDMLERLQELRQMVGEMMSFQRTESLAEIYREIDRLIEDYINHRIPEK